MQLALFTEPPRPPGAAAPGGGREPLLRRLGRRLDGRLRAVTLTDNRTRILTVRPAGRRDPRGLTVRIHRCFAAAPAPVLEAVAEFCRAAVAGRRDRDAAARRRLALVTIRAHFEAHRPAAPAARKPAALRPRGRHHDLAAIRDELNRRWFGGRLTAAISWGRGRSRRAAACRGRRATLQLGSYSLEDDLIRIHPALDRADVPSWVIASVVHHELLHAELPPRVVNGRRMMHTAEFRRRERAFPDFARAERWVARNLTRLLKG
jgi:hypothetical protein